jgi:hypothetical protein
LSFPCQTLVVYTPLVGGTPMTVDNVTASRSGFRYCPNVTAGHSAVTFALFGYPSRTVGFVSDAFRNPNVGDTTNLALESYTYQANETYDYGSGGTSGHPIFNDTYSRWIYDSPGVSHQGIQFQPYPSPGIVYSAYMHSGIGYAGRVQFDTSAAAWTGWSARGRLQSRQSIPRGR